MIYEDTMVNIITGKAFNLIGKEIDGYHFKL